MAVSIAVTGGLTEADADALAVRPSSLQLAQGSSPVNVEIATACEDGYAVFKIVNKGNEWPTVAKFSVYRVVGNTLVSQRRMRLTSSQMASFLMANTLSVHGMEWFCP